MRRHSLTDHPARIAAGLVALAVVAVGAMACSTLPPPSTGIVGITISTAAGERLAFVPAETTVAAAESVDVVFTNASSLAHNLVFIAGSTAATRTIVMPGTSDQLVVELPEPGRYDFVCTIHDGMTGSLIVE